MREMEAESESREENLSEITLNHFRPLIGKSGRERKDWPSITPILRHATTAFRRKKRQRNVYFGVCEGRDVWTRDTRFSCLTMTHNDSSSHASSFLFNGHHFNVCMIIQLLPGIRRQTGIAWTQLVHLFFFSPFFFLSGTDGIEAEAAVVVCLVTEPFDAALECVRSALLPSSPDLL